MPSRPALKSPISLGSIFDEGKLGARVNSLVELFRLQKTWPQIVGEEMARRTRPKSLQGKTLMVSVESSVWAQHLSMMSTEILKQVNAKIGRKLGAVRFVNESLPPQREKTRP